MSNDATNYEKIIPTAWLVAYNRTFSDIPYTQEIFRELDTLRNTNTYKGITQGILASNLSPQFEARYKLTNRMILQHPHPQILEIAAGFTPRGLEFCKDKDLVFVEFDLPQVICDKIGIVNNISRRDDRRNLYFCTGDALNVDSLMHVSRFFDKNKPLTIINEGLLRYLNMDEKKIYASNVHKLLEMYGGVWITPDATLKHVIFNEDKNVMDHNKLVQNLTGINTDNNRFETEPHARKFFEDLGFTVEKHSYLEALNVLTSPQKLGTKDKVLHEMLEYAVVYVMKIKN